MKKPFPPFVEYLTREILPNIIDFEVRAMMGGYILRSDGVTFSILDENLWYLRTIPETESWYLAHGCQKFQYTNVHGKVISMPYHQLPESVFDDRKTLQELILESIVAAKIAKNK